MHSPLRRLADQLIEGGVDRFITDRRSNDASWRSIALAIRDETDGAVDIAPETVRTWHSQIISRTAA